MVYGRQPSTSLRDAPSISEPHSIDLAFLGHERTWIRRAGGPVEPRRIAPGTGGLHGGDAVEFVAVCGPSEYVELTPSEAVRADAAEHFRAPAVRAFDEIPGVEDAVLWAVAARFRGHATGGAPIDALGAEALIRTLVARLAVSRLGGRPPRVNDHRLSTATLARVRARVEARIAEPVTIADLAAVAHQSPYHFMRMFARTTGVRPHAFVRAVRMERARGALLAGASVAEAARGVGYAGGHSFRMAFRQCFGVLPSAYVRSTTPPR